ncbi:hypothetical protein SAY87_014693 [Trapa incisa]|uniref:Peptide N-acetyl-beta-D-glucosaminyl asparaginase amidase A N-terminal domain-containing protein n=1 Tax=Trapa incisa TaxID=236973 RepID=A0AAN7H311_9MYRT|nr:hypothetical protein SAY87_014693 [Trapa incisa]
MATSSSLLSLFLLIHHFISSATANNLHRSRYLRPSPVLDSILDSSLTYRADSPTRFFEVTKPIDTPPAAEPFSYLVLRHQFAFTYGKPPVLATYIPPSDQGCPFGDFSNIVLEWTATCRGRQFDRIFGVWLGGVELLRSCTAEPRPTGIVWTVQKDITRYHSLLMKNGTLAVYLGNLITKVYTGIYDVNITIHFYPAGAAAGLDSSKPLRGYHSTADLILPISRKPHINDGLWFKIENSTDTESKKFRIPPNVYRAVLEVYVSFHENDEFWYGNYPNEYIKANNLTSVAGNGPFREVLVTLDRNTTVGSVWPFTVIFTGGVNPLFWRPITAVGSFDLPSYDIEITPFLSRILDGEPHELGFSITNALNVWYVDANLHLWLDHKSKRTESELVSYSSSPVAYSSELEVNGLDGKFIIGANRSISATGWVRSSYGKITTVSNQRFEFSNTMVVGNEANLQIIEQTIRYDDKVDLKTEESSCVRLVRSYKKFPFKFYSNTFDQGNETYSLVANVTLAFNEKKVVLGVPGSKLRNAQKADGYMVVKDNLVVSGLGSTSEVYRFDRNGGCYFRNVSSSNYTILYDDVRRGCGGGRREWPPLGFDLSSSGIYPFRKAFIESDEAMNGD